MLIVCFKAIGRAVFAELENQEMFLVAVCEFKINNSGEGLSYNDALSNAVAIADALNSKYSKAGK